MDSVYAYDMLDRFLRNNLDDDDYAEYLEALDYVFSPMPTLEIDKHKTEIESIRAKVAELEGEVAEQARLNGIGSEREARLMARVDELHTESNRFYVMANDESFKTLRLEAMLREIVSAWDSWKEPEKVHALMVDVMEKARKMLL